MTAILGILNKSAVALAADSAVTVTSTNGSKIYNTANKIFNLCQNKPVAIAIYNSAEFMGIPWETIIKMYRTEIKSKTFNSLINYRDDFLRFVKTTISFLGQRESEEVALKITDTLLQIIDNDLKNQIELEFPNENWIAIPIENRKTKIKEFLGAIIKKHKENVDNNNELEEFKEYKLDEFKAVYSSTIVPYINTFLEIYSFKEEADIIELISSLAFDIIKKDYFFESWSGIIICGFGEMEIFPSLYSIKIGGIINKDIRFKFENNTQISLNMSGSIEPFAQRDIIDTFIQGEDPFIIDAIPEIFSETLFRYRDLILDKVSDPDKSNLESYINGTISSVIDVLNTRLNELRKVKHIDPIIHTISILSKEDLAEMAESLINLTYLKRRASSDEESVSGPVDVALITKGDGFIWIKRKHYFKPELNLNYIAKLLNK